MANCSVGSNIDNESIAFVIISHMYSVF